jgi:hypothetical protein
MFSKGICVTLYVCACGLYVYGYVAIGIYGGEGVCGKGEGGYV